MTGMQESRLCQYPGAPMYTVLARRIRRPGPRKTAMLVHEFTRQIPPLGAVTTFRLVSSLEHGIASLVAWRRARATTRVLRKLSDHQLADIGLHRGDIVELAAGLARG
jgi:uncharacterized protein YjiS (DUF1127 family)